MALFPQSIVPFVLNNKMKECIKCGIITNDFHIKNSNKDGLHNECKNCRNESVREYQKTKNGLITEIYSHQKLSSKQRNHLMPTYTKLELKVWCFAQKLFHELYDNWKSSNYQNDLIPSVDRLNDYSGYSLDNIQLMTWRENEQKGHNDMKNGINNKNSKSVLQYDLKENFIKEFYSVSEAGRQVGIYKTSISQCCNGLIKTSGGFKWKFK